MCGQDSNLRLCLNSALPTELPHTTHWLMFPTFISGTYWLSTQSRIGTFDSFTSTFPCRWALSYCQVYARRLVQCRQLFLNTNQFPSCREHPVSPDLCYWVGIEPTLMDRYGIEPHNMEQHQSYIHKLWPLCVSYPLEYYPPPIFCLQWLCMANQHLEFSCLWCHPPTLNVDLLLLSLISCNFHEMIVLIYQRIPSLNNSYNQVLWLVPFGMW